MSLTVQQWRRMRDTMLDTVNGRWRFIAAKSVVVRSRILDSHTAVGAAERLRGVSK